MNSGAEVTTTQTPDMQFQKGNEPRDMGGTPSQTPAPSAPATSPVPAPAPPAAVPAPAIAPVKPA
jgi:hypothetical protein